MAHQHVFLVQDEAFGLPSLKKRSKMQRGGEKRIERLLAAIVDFDHPRTGEPTKFMVLGDNVLELQVARPRGQERASFFIDQSVNENGDVFMASRVDPLFLLLPVLMKHARKWCPLDQALAEAGCGSLRGLRHLDAPKLCDVNDRLGPEDLLIRVNEDSVMAWLTEKVERATKRFIEVAKRQQTGAGNTTQRGEGSATGFTVLISTNDPGERAVLEARSKQQALEAVCEYLRDDWAERVAKKFSTERAVLFGEKPATTKKRKTVWEESAEVDKNLKLSLGDGGGMKAKSEVATAGTKSKPTLTQGQKSLARVNTKGMKSITSFFSK